jgi:hypothetical protein
LRLRSSATEAVAVRLQAAYKHRLSAGRLPRDERRMETRTGFDESDDGWMGRARGGRETSAVAAAGTDIGFGIQRRKGCGRCEEAMASGAQPVELFDGFGSDAFGASVRATAVHPSSRGFHRIKRLL